MTKILPMLMTAIIVFVLAMSCSKKSGDPVKQITTYAMDIFKIMKENANDCTKAIDGVKAYIEKNRKEIEAAAKHFHELQSKMSPEEKKKQDEKMKKEMESVLKDSMEAMLKIGKECPDKMPELQQAMQVLSPQHSK